MNPYEQFKAECASEISAMGDDAELRRSARGWMDRANAAKYSYHY